MDDRSLGSMSSQGGPKKVEKATRQQGDDFDDDGSLIDAEDAEGEGAEKKKKRFPNPIKIIRDRFERKRIEDEKRLLKKDALMKQDIGTKRLLGDTDETLF
jgi:hypothetical protein